MCWKNLSTGHVFFKKIYNWVVLVTFMVTVTKCLRSSNVKD